MRALTGASSRPDEIPDGEEAGLVVPGPKHEAAGQGAAGPKTICLSMIVKNEEHVVARGCASVRDSR